MKILIVTPYLPWPLNTGGNTAQYALLDYLRKKHDFTIIVQTPRPDSYAAVAELEKMWPQVKIILIGKKATGVKSLVQSTIIAARNLKKIIKPEEEFLKSFYPLWLLPKEIIEVVSSQLQAESYDIVQVEFSEPMSIVHVLPDSVKKVFVHHQIHYKYVQRTLETLNISPDYYKYFLNPVKSQELACLQQYDAILTFSKIDQEIIKKELQDTSTYISPFPIITPDINEHALGVFHEKLVYLGGEEHYPNKDAVEWFLTEIWTKIFQQKPNLKFYIIGKWTSKTINKYSSLPNVIFTGFVPSLPEILTGSIMVVPLRIASGIRTKILDAMANGVPVVSTIIGCEGLPVVDGKDIVVADCKDNFIEAVLSLTENLNLRKEITQNGLKVVRSKYTQLVAGEMRDEIYKTIVNIN